MKVFLDTNICLDLLDTTRPTSKRSIKWYMEHKDNLDLQFYFSADFITTIYYVLTQKRKVEPIKVLSAIEQLSFEVMPHYLKHSDFINAKEIFIQTKFNDFEDLFVLSSATRIGCGLFITNDKKLLELKNFSTLQIQAP